MNKHEPICTMVLWKRRIYVNAEVIKFV
ncbi:hypothetical protein EMIT07CA2_120072 [Brevibacillus sp. IT-7CA2]